eukprot:TRINITY_DN4589_c0_g2_i3.p1 TRINITY_DN4589_c0_g2~~TRINITY_DN4589_c0_g2_i3.p1  ORF type:complete len:426 (-),score=60.41 TRINITY_DN4589_c0_g2_i3:357-1586(-)
MLSTNFKLGQPQGSAFVRSTPKRVVVRSRVGVGCVKATAVAEEVVPLQQPYGRVFNFSAGPACLPLDILEQVRDDVVSWQGCGMSVMEMSHRGKEFDSIIKSAEADLRQLLSIPDNYQVLFLQGGASTQFSAVPLNLTAEGDSVDQLITGSWSKKAQSEAEKYCNANVAAKGDNKSIPPPSEWKLSENGKYLHYCDNETIQGVEFQAPPEVSDRVLVADMSSNFCSKPVDVSKYGVIYAGAQKNIGPAGVTVVIVREDLVGNARAITPVMLDYKTMTETQSMYNTPPCWSIYVCGLVFKKLLREGGLEGMLERNKVKAKVVYDAIAESQGFYNCPVDPAVRSNMNVPFTIPSNPDLEKEFISEASKVGLVQLKGHRSVGGMRASIYNSMPLEGCQQLASFMKSFAAKHS